jgi:nucleoside-triphosphatase THEP1
MNWIASNDPTLAVVIIDEIGLAEISVHNPLKVIHSLLDNPKVPTIGLSNWLLDASKMNRGITLSRPDPDDDDLKESALSIAKEIFKERKCQGLEMSFKNTYLDSFV